MKKLIYTLCAFAILAFLVTGCKKDFLSFDFTEGPVSEENVWGSDRNARGFLNYTYRGLLARYDLGDGALMASASDESVNSSLNNRVNIINNGTWAAVNTFDDQYTNLYSSLRSANIFLQESPTSRIFPTTDIPGLRGEAFFLRGMFHFELFKRYGKIVLAKRSFTSGEDLNLPRNTVEEVVQHIVMDCDSAVSLIPAVWTGTGAGVPYDSGYDPNNRGRATKAAALALKARVLLYLASPLYNTSNDISRWRNAANAAKALIDLNKHSLLSPTEFPNLWNYNLASTQYNREVIFATTAVLTNNIEESNAPVGFNSALGRTNPTQNLVDAFEMSNGKPISDPTSGYNVNNPYVNRDPRLNQFIVFNGSTFSTGTLSRAVETFDGGLDNVQSNLNSTKTGYYLRKFLSTSATFNIPSPASIRRPWVLFRYAETLLNYAEALNEAIGATAEVYSAVNQIRTRSGMPVLPVGLTQVQMRDLIRNERRVELCFEEHRFFDVRRWNLGETILNGPVRGMKIIKSGTTFIYTPFIVENRVFANRNYLYPISQTEISKSPNLIQNPGY
ncbi:MAG TPA: RagB/SusD family nutrient uptake outer membrane protein [Sphingobacteriaceae bacterium]|nr:RagB/SusD family nutrient uptake outer membrane protein [Sphingobacteriaceae bacterium]